MSNEFRFEIVGEARSTLLCRVMGFFAQLDLAAPNANVSIERQIMVIRILPIDLELETAKIICMKFRNIIGITKADLLDDAGLKIMS